MDAINSPYPEDSRPELLQALCLQMARTIANYVPDRNTIALVNSLFDTLDVKEITAGLKAFNEGRPVIQEYVSREDNFNKLYDMVGAFIQQSEISEYTNEDGIPLIQNKAYVDLKFFYEFPDAEVKD